jgi:hypothetical protein
MVVEEDLLWYMDGTYAMSSIDISYDVLLEAYLLDFFGACIWHVGELHIGTCS